MPEAATLDFISPCAVSVTPHYEEDGEPAELTACAVLSGGLLRLRDREAVPLEWPVNESWRRPRGRAPSKCAGARCSTGGS
ncbi:hypothetical protein [Herbidospora sp. RD11066]